MPTAPEMTSILSPRKPFVHKEVLIKVSELTERSCDAHKSAFSARRVLVIADTGEARTRRRSDGAFLARGRSEEESDGGSVSTSNSDKTRHKSDPSGMRHAFHSFWFGRRSL